MEAPTGMIKDPDGSLYKEEFKSIVSCLFAFFINRLI